MYSDWCALELDSFSRLKLDPSTQFLVFPHTFIRERVRVKEDSSINVPESLYPTKLADVNRALCVLLYDKVPWSVEACCFVGWADSKAFRFSIHRTLIETGNFSTLFHPS